MEYHRALNIYIRKGEHTLPFAVCRLTIGVTTKKKTRCIGYTRIGHRTGRRVFFERIETDDVTTVITQRDDSAAVICLHRKPHTKSRGKKAGYQPAQQTKEEKGRKKKKSPPPFLKENSGHESRYSQINIDRVRKRA